MLQREGFVYSGFPRLLFFRLRAGASRRVGFYFVFFFGGGGVGVVRIKGFLNPRRMSTAPSKPPLSPKHFHSALFLAQAPRGPCRLGFPGGWAA